MKHIQSHPMSKDTLRFIQDDNNWYSCPKGCGDYNRYLPHCTICGTTNKNIRKEVK